MLPDISLNIVLLPERGCTLDVPKLHKGHLTGYLNLSSRDDVEIVPAKEPREPPQPFLRIRCKDWSVKNHILSWDTRSRAMSMFSLKIKEDLFKHERLQKARMWPVMQALFQADLRPSWKRASVTWKTPDARLFIHPGELPDQLTAADVVSYAHSGCKHIPAVQTKSYADALKSAKPATPVSTSSQGVQADFPSPSTAPTQHCITALQQDLHNAKVARAKKAIECCMLRKQLAKAKELKSPLPRPNKPINVQTNSSCETSAQTDSSLTSSSPDDIIDFDFPNGPKLRAPKSASFALHALHDWWTQDSEQKMATLTTQILDFEARMKAESDEQYKEMKAEIAEKHQLFAVAKKKVDDLMQQNQDLSNRITNLTACSAKQKKNKAP